MPNTGNEFQSAKTHCPAGHEYTAANTKLCKSTRPGFFKRQCRTCKNELTERARTRDRLLKAIEADDTNAAASSQVLQTLEAIRAQELAARAERKIANAAARKIRAADAQRERSRQQRGARAALDPVDQVAPIDQDLAPTLAPAIAVRAPIAFAPPPRRPRPFKRLAIKFCEWRDRQEYRQRHGTQERIWEAWQAPR
ncbi:hypothetical protein ABIB00_005039 [Bradyrhizobium sp. LB14.3]|uniref:hypothetical protein n=1 Tax=Bradyrhizobium sp. LB14.3 TaxID=3156328 RepID=UPI003390A724